MDMNSTLQTDRQALEQIETLLEQFLNRQGEPNEQLVSDALGIAATVLARPSVESQQITALGWQANPDRSGGAFTQQEIVDRMGWR